MIKYKTNKIFSSKGRMKRKEFALFHLLYILLGVAGLIAMYIGTAVSVFFIKLIFFAAGLVLFLLIAIIYLISAVKRLHDLNHSGWVCLISLIPYVNILFWLYLLFRKSVDKNNKY